MISSPSEASPKTYLARPKLTAQAPRMARSGPDAVDGSRSANELGIGHQFPISQGIFRVASLAPNDAATFVDATDAEIQRKWAKIGRFHNMPVAERHALNTLGALSVPGAIALYYDPLSGTIKASRVFDSPEEAVLDAVKHVDLLTDRELANAARHIEVSIVLGRSSGEEEQLMGGLLGALASTFEAADVALDRLQLVSYDPTTSVAPGTLHRWDGADILERLNAELTKQDHSDMNSQETRAERLRQRFEENDQSWRQIFDGYVQAKVYGDVDSVDR